MPLSALTGAEVGNAQVQYVRKIAKAYANNTDVYSWFGEAPKDMVNYSGLKQPFEVSPNPSFGSGFANGGAYSTPGSSNLDNFNVYYTFLNQGTSIGYAADLNKNANTSEDTTLYSIASSLKQFYSFLNSYASNANGTLGLATVSANYAGGTPTIATCNGTSDSLGCTQLVTGGKYLFYNAAGTTQRTGTVGANPIVLASKTGSVATFASNIPSDVVATDIIVPEVSDATDAAAGIYGLPIIFGNTGTYYGKARSSYDGLCSYVKSMGGALTAAALYETYASVAQRGGWINREGNTGELADQLTLIMNLGNLSAYYGLSLNSGAVVSSPWQLNSVGSSKPNLDIGGANPSRVTWFGAPIKLGTSVMGSEIYFAGRNDIRRAILKDVGEAPRSWPSADWLQGFSSSNYATSKVKFTDFFGNFYSPNPFRIGKISGITLSAPTQKSTNVVN